MNCNILAIILSRFLSKKRREKSHSISPPFFNHRSYIEITQESMDEAERTLYKIISLRNKRSYSLKKEIPIEDVLEIINHAYEYFADEPILLNIPAPVHVVGDIHGNIDDLLRIFQEVGYPPKQKYLFLGDYEDRGKFGVEVNLFLMSLKVKFPNHIFMIRGNHELVHVSQNYGFQLECRFKYNEKLFFQFHSLFKELPIAALVMDRIFCVHGGISPRLKKIGDLHYMDKPDDIMDDGMLADLVWSDPKDITKNFQPDERGLGFFYNKDALESFLDKNDLDLLIRSHELCEGYNFPYKDSDRCITVFSNTDYCGTKNSAAIINISKTLHVTVTKFKLLNSDEKRAWQAILPEWLIDYASNLKEKPINEEDPSSEVDIIHKEQGQPSVLLHSDAFALVE